MGIHVESHGHHTLIGMIKKIPYIIILPNSIINFVWPLEHNL